MDRLESMRTLLAAVEAGSLSAASRKLGVPLPTVSRKVSELEAHLKTQLVQRTSRRLLLTDAGRAYAAAAKRILEDIEQAERAASGEYLAPRGDLVVTAPIVFGRLHVLPVAAEFLKAFPEINLRLQLSDRNMNLLEDDIDLALRIGNLPDSSLIAVNLGTIRQIVVGAPAYLKAAGTPRHPRDLHARDCVTFEGLSAPESWRFFENGKPVLARIRSRLVVNTAEAAIDAALAGTGLTRVLSYQAEAAIRAGKLRIVLEKFEPEPRPVSFVYAARSLVPLKLRAFLDFAAPRIRKRIAGLRTGRV